MKHKVAVLTLTLVGLIALMLVWSFYRNYRIAARYEEVGTGASDQQVSRLLGPPSWTEPCGKSFGSPKANCTEYIYRNSFAPLIPEYYSIRFDASGHVVDKYIYESP